MKKSIFFLVLGIFVFASCSSMNDFLGKANDVMADTNSILSGDIDEVTEGDFTVEKVVIVSSRANDEALAYFLAAASKSSFIIKPLEEALATTIIFKDGVFEVPEYAQSVRKSDLERARDDIGDGYVSPDDEYGNQLGVYRFSTNFDGSILTITGVRS